MVTNSKALSGQELCKGRTKDQQKFPRQMTHLRFLKCMALVYLKEAQRSNPTLQTILPLHRLSTDSIPLVSEFTQHVIQLQVVIGQGRFLLQGTSSSVGGVVD